MRALSLNQLIIDLLGCGYARENVTQTVTLSKLTGTMGLIVVWTEIALDGHTEPCVFPRGGIMSARHRSAILEPIGRPHECAIGDAFILMQDNARAHTALVSMTFIDDTGISLMNCPTRSPDANPTEHTWGILSRRIRQRPHHPENVQNLIDALFQKLQAIPLNGIRSMTRFCQECVNDMGGQASYW